MSEKENWLQEGLRTAGEELIRRSKEVSFDAWDAIRELKVTIHIPSDVPGEIPIIRYEFDTFNKIWVDEKFMIE